MKKQGSNDVTKKLSAIPTLSIPLVGRGAFFNTMRMPGSSLGQVITVRKIPKKLYIFIYQLTKVYSVIKKHVSALT